MNRMKRRRTKKLLKKVEIKKTSIANVLDSLIKEFVGEDFKEKYNNELIKFFQFVVNPSEKLDLHEIMRQIPDKVFSTLHQLIIHHPIFSGYEKIFQIELLWRNEELKEDWFITWSDKFTYSIHFLKK